MKCKSKYHLKLIKAAIIFVSMLIGLNKPLAAETIETRLAMADFISEMIQCAVFYSILASGEDPNGNPIKKREQFQNLSENIYMISYNLAEEINMKSETLLAIAEDHSNEMGEAIDFDAINIRILTKKYGEFCKALVQKPEDRLRYWLLRKSN